VSKKKKNKSHLFIRSQRKLKKPNGNRESKKKRPITKTSQAVQQQEKKPKRTKAS
jgi:hypothetical protein